MERNLQFTRRTWVDQVFALRTTSGRFWRWSLHCGGLGIKDFGFQILRRD